MCSIDCDMLYRDLRTMKTVVQRRGDRQCCAAGLQHADECSVLHDECNCDTINNVTRRSTQCWCVTPVTASATALQSSCATNVASGGRHACCATCQHSSFNVCDDDVQQSFCDECNSLQIKIRSNRVKKTSKTERCVFAVSKKSNKTQRRFSHRFRKFLIFCLLYYRIY